MIETSQQRVHDGDLLGAEGAIERFLTEAGIPVVDTLTFERIGDGLSNITYKVTGSGVSMVLRRPPRPPFNPGAHDVIREARYVDAARRSGVPAARIVARETTGEVIGVPFVLIQFIDGEIFTDAVDEGRLPADSGRTVVGNLVTGLADIHAIDWRRHGLGDEGRAAGFLRRHIGRTRELSTSTGTRTVPGLRDLTNWVVNRIPEQSIPGVMHGDYRSGNVMFEKAPSTEIAAVLDWENAAVGDPLLDLAYFVNTYPHPDEKLGMLTGMSAFAARAGFPSRGEIVSDYQQKRGITLDDSFVWYRAASLWHTAIGLESLYARVIDGRQHHDDLSKLEDEVPRLVEQALGVIDGVV